MTCKGIMKGIVVYKHVWDPYSWLTDMSFDPHGRFPKIYIHEGHQTWVKSVSCPTHLLYIGDYITQLYREYTKPL